MYLSDFGQCELTVAPWGYATERELTKRIEALFNAGDTEYELVVTPRLVKEMTGRRRRKR